MAGFPVSPPAARTWGVLMVVLVMTVGPWMPAAHAQSLLLLWSRGPDVAEWQQQLNQILGADLKIDGIYGPVTAATTRQFQRSAGIEDDGVVGPETRAAARGGAVPTGDLLQRGARGPEVGELQSRLRDLNYWVGPVDGIFGTLTQQAVTAFQKVNRMDRSGEVDARFRSTLANPAAPAPRSTRPGLVAEVDKASQILMLVVDGRVQQIFNVSTGTEEYYTFEGRRYLADTPVGEWIIDREIDGWRQSNLGRLYRPKYFHRDGIAFHGYPNVPSYPASHGCVRVSMAAMDYLWGRLPIGTPVLVV